MKEELKRLWKNTFGDPDSYIDFFFTYIYKEENALYIRQNDKIVSALHLIPYSMTWNNKIVPVSYICGVATVAEERGKGLMFSLMQQAHQLSKKRGDYFTVLIPANSDLFTYYRKIGYHHFFYYETYNYIQKELKDTFSDHQIHSINDFLTTEVFDFFNLQLRRRKACILHTFEDFLCILHEMELSEGFLKILTDKEKQIIGMAFVFPSMEEDNQLFIKELIYTDEKTKEILLYKIAQLTDSGKVTIRQPVQKRKAIPFGMIHCINENEFCKKNTNRGYMSLMLE